MKNTSRAARDGHAGSGTLEACAPIPSAKPESLEQLLTQIAAARNQAAFAKLYSATKGKLFSTVVSIVRRWDLTEEIIQDVYVRIWLNAHSYRASSGSPMTWMITIARNLAIDTVRRSVRETCADDTELLALPSDEPTVLETIEADEERRAAIDQKQRVLSALQALDPARRDLVIAAYIHGESREQLSRRAGVPVNTVKTWIRRALLEVQAILSNTETGGCDSANPASRGGPAVFRTAASPPRASRARTAASAV
jgi:RNA polymerase sigma-70 factor, ECF subfamily